MLVNSRNASLHSCLWSWRCQCLLELLLAVIRWRQREKQQFTLGQFRLDSLLTSHQCFWNEVGSERAHRGDTRTQGQYVNIVIFKLVLSYLNTFFWLFLYPSSSDTGSESHTQRACQWSAPAQEWNSERTPVWVQLWESLSRRRFSVKCWEGCFLVCALLEATITIWCHGCTWSIFGQTTRLKSFIRRWISKSAFCKLPRMLEMKTTGTTESVTAAGF